MKRWNWNRVLYGVAVLSALAADQLFGDADTLAVVAGCVAFLVWSTWKLTRSKRSFREAMAVMFPPRDRRILIRLLALVALFGLVAMPAAYYYGLTGFPWHLIASGVAIVAGVVFAWRARRSSQASAGL